MGQSQWCGIHSSSSFANITIIVSTDVVVVCASTSTIVVDDVVGLASVVVVVFRPGVVGEGAAIDLSSSELTSVARCIVVVV